jgi:hypothetical protein
LGNERELVVAIFLTLTTSHNIEAAIAIPLIAIVLKKKLEKLCNH